MEKWKYGFCSAEQNSIDRILKKAVMQKLYSVIRKIGLTKTYYVWICSNRYLGFLTLCMDTSQLRLSYAALCLKNVLICKCNSLLIAAVLKESIGDRPFLCVNAVLN